MNERSTRPLRVAVVEDHDGFREDLCCRLNEAEDMDCVFVAATVQEARDGLAAATPDVLLLDLLFDGAPEGIALASELSAQLPGLEIVVLTVVDSKREVFEALRAGACGYLVKGCTGEEILQAVRGAAAGESPMSGSIARMVVRSFRDQPNDSLTPQEWEILRGLAEGKQDKEISRTLGISPRTVHSHCRSIYRKLHVSNRQGAVEWWRKGSKGGER